MKKIVFLVLIIFNINYLLAETITGSIVGIDKDEKIPLSKVTVRILGTDKGTYSDANGKFKIEIPNKNSKLIVSYIGYKTDTVLASKDIVIELKSDLTLEGITVTGKAEQFQISQSNIVNSFTITERGLRKAACCNLAESFVTNAAADVEYTDAVSGARQIRLLGLDGTYTQLLTENVPSMRGLSAIYGLGYIPGPWMKSIAISKGTASVVNGFEGITGQINIEYKKPEDDKPLFLNFFGDQFGRMEVNADLSQRINEKLSTMTLLHANVNQFAHDENGDSFSDHPILSQINLLNRWNYAGDDMESVSAINFLYEDRKAGQMDFLNNNNDKEYGINVATTRLQAFTKNGFFVGDANSSIGTIASFTYHNHDSKYGKNPFKANQLSFYANAFYDTYFSREKETHDHSQDHDHDGDGVQDHPSSHDSEHSVAVETEDIHNLKMGASFQADLYDQSFEKYNQDIQEYIPGIFTEYTFTGIKDLSMTFGLRGDWHNKYSWFFTPRMHFKYNIDELNTLRLSLGKGSRTSYVLSDYSSVLASSREIIISNDLKREEAYNLGLNYVSEFIFLGVPITMNMDFFHTQFENQIVADYDVSYDKIIFSNLDGKSYSNSFQIDFISEPFDFLTLTTAYRYNDVKITYHNELMEKPLISPHKVFANFAFSTRNDVWMIDFTINYNSSGRLPFIPSLSNSEGKVPTEFDGYLTFYTHITRKFSGWEIYLGAENLGGFVQNNPIIGYNDPFSKNFDSSVIWGPTMGRVVYLGVRISNDIY
ncbi:MAG TPA: carboxypeptidase-like regulatory domain-containing protein [Candidatus Kapabacteria bacterium]|nr:carboxypeptidase-like regulatory domain-containing protein [Candidatus Kapabacteria bacterium]